ncbi:MAG TPA: nitroreductase family protein [Acidobacteriota bacterium]|nr:nitroreductase family protein [Acidobacteriota bacterium]
MSGIVFMKSKQLATLHEFYVSRIGCQLWLDQGDCLIFRHGNFLFGFCERDSVDAAVMLTFVYENREEVDRMFASLEPISTTTPSVNPKYKIYQFFATDPEGRTLEFQHFANPVARHRSGENLLLSRRSIREFSEEQIPERVLREVLDVSRFAPTANNSQPYYFKILRDTATLEWLSTVRGSSTGPLAKAPLAVAICADPAVSGRFAQDACIAAYHFMLAAWFCGLGTCWIGGMDRDDVKPRIGIPLDHHVATVTPLGFPAERQVPAPERKCLDDFVRD